MKSVLLFLMFGAAEPAGGHGYHSMELGYLARFLQQYLRDYWAFCDMPAQASGVRFLDDLGESRAWGRPVAGIA